MKSKFLPVDVAVEKWTIPTYPIPEAEEMPMFAETCVHQGTTGNPYPNRVVSAADGEHRSDKEWTVIRLENDYIRLAVIPALGGRIFEAYDKVTGYDFLYRQHVIKPALIGAYGAWISGGIEFNWPFHHRPSTVMPVDYEIERKEDGSAIVWLSEHAPNDRTKGMVGVVLRPDTNYFETRMAVTNRTPVRHNFLWWENAAVAVHEGYRLVFPPDVTYVHHHNDAGHTTFPIASGQYGADNIKEPKDISWHKNSRIATSYFAAPSKYDFFGGFDYVKNCGVLHIANHHISPGKKMFTWGYGSNADNWEKKLTDSDGQYAELMAGCYTDDQPDFTWLAPYETKCFSQFWYPTQGIGYTTNANLDAAVALDRENGEIRFNVTSVRNGVTLTLKGADGRILLEQKVDMTPSAVVSYKVDYPVGELLNVTVTCECGKLLLDYTEETPDYVHIPENNSGTPLPDKLTTPCELVNAGKHVDQYRSAYYKPDLYYLEALDRDPNYLPALKALGEYYTRTLRFEDALEYLNRAYKIECRYNQNPEDGLVNYLRGICLAELGKYDDAYDKLYRAYWSYNVISPAMTAIAAIDGCRGEYDKMYEHAQLAIEKEAKHPIASCYAALAQYKLGNTRRASAICREVLERDKLNHLARYVLTIVSGRGRNSFYSGLLSNPAQTVLDIAFDLSNAGFVSDAATLVKGAIAIAPDNAMLNYTLAYYCDQLGNARAAAKYRKAASKQKIVDVFPSRAGEIRVLRAAIKANAKDGFAAYLLGCIMYDSRVYESAADLWEKAIKFLPDFYIPYRNLALVYFNHLERAADALPLMRKAIELHDKDATLLCEMATVMQESGTSYEEGARFIDEHKPDVVTDQIQLTIARAYNAAGQFDKAESVMRSHIFSPGEGAEFATAEPYMYACFGRGRVALKDGRYEDALADFRASQKMPENLNVGFWNESVMMPYRYYEAEALKRLGRDEEAKEIITKLASMKDVGMWNMGGEFVYYSAMSVRLGGEEMRAQRIMRDAILRWERELERGCKYHRQASGLYNCFVGNHTRNRLSTLYGMLGYGKLFNGDYDGAKSLFAKSIELKSSPKIAFELSLLD
jgi:tetratricopeptide (TPR) repeat protein